MDQYVVEFDMAMLYFDLMDLIHLIEESENEDLKRYLEYLQKQLDDCE